MAACRDILAIANSALGGPMQLANGALGYEPDDSDMEVVAFRRSETAVQLEFNPVILIDDSSDEEMAPAQEQLGLAVPEVHDGHGSVDFAITHAEAETMAPAEEPLHFAAQEVQDGCGSMELASTHAEAETTALAEEPLCFAAQEVRGGCWSMELASTHVGAEVHETDDSQSSCMRECRGLPIVFGPPDASMAPAEVPLRVAAQEVQDGHGSMEPATAQAEAETMAPAEEPLHFAAQEVQDGCGSMELANTHAEAETMAPAEVPLRFAAQEVQDCHASTAQAEAETTAPAKEPLRFAASEVQAGHGSMELATALAEAETTAPAQEQLGFAVPEVHDGHVSMEPASTQAESETQRHFDEHQLCTVSLEISSRNSRETEGSDPAQGIIAAQVTPHLVERMPQPSEQAQSCKDDVQTQLDADTDTSKLEAECHLEVMNDTARTDSETVTHNTVVASELETEDDWVLKVLLPISHALENDAPQVPGLRPQEPARGLLSCAFCSRRSKHAPKRNMENNGEELGEPVQKHRKL